MNKKLLAIAVGAAMVAAATAATAGNAPTFYGKIHLSIDSMDNDAASPNDDDGIFVSSNSSRLGIKGSEDLGGGLSAVYKYEMSTNYSNSGLAGNRNAYLGLKGGFGQVIAGRHDMPFKTIGRKHDLFGDAIGDNRAVSRLKFDGDDWADRRDNVLMYTNKFGAVGLKIAYGSEESANDDNKDTADIGIGIDFKQGPLGVMFVHETHGKGNLTGGDNKESTGISLMGSYGMGNMKFLAGYSNITDVGGNDGVDHDLFTLGAAMKSGKNTFKVQYTMGEFDCTGCSDVATSIAALGVDHKFTKNTTGYAQYAVIDNDDNVDFAFSGTGHDGTVAAGGDGDSPSGISVGMIHKF